MKTQPLDPLVTSEIKTFVNAEMARFGLRDIKVSTGVDHDGDPVIFIDIAYDQHAPALDVRATASLVTKLRNHLWAMSEERFPHIRHHFAAEQKVVGF